MIPSWPSSATSSRGNRPRRSVSAATGFTRDVANARTVSRSWRCVSVSAICTLASLPGRRPFGAKGLESLGAILGCERHPERLHLVATPGRAVDGGADRRGPLRQAERDRWLPGQLSRERHRLGTHPVPRHHPVDEADAERVLRQDRLPEVDELARPAESHAPDETLRAPEARDKAEVDLRLAEAYPFPGDQQIAGERQLEAAAQRDAVEGSDHGDAEHLDPGHG